MPIHRIALLFALSAAWLSACSTQSPPSTASTPASTPAATPSAPQTAPPPAAVPAAPAAIKAGDTNISGIVAEVTECSRKEGVLSVKVRFRNTSSEKKNLNLIENRDYEKYYVTAANKKYFILKDTEGTYLTAQASGFGNLGVGLDPGGQYTWWAKYPAPPAEVRAVTLYTPVAAPLEDVPVTDR